MFEITKYARTKLLKILSEMEIEDIISQEIGMGYSLKNR